MTTSRSSAAIGTAMSVSLVCAVLCGPFDTARAADLGAAPPRIIPIERPPTLSFISELRAGVFAHDPFSPERGGYADLNGEVLFRKPWVPADPAWAFLVPRIHLGGTANFVGKTSHLYAGFTWTYDVTQQLFVEGSFGGAVHDGYTGSAQKLYHNKLGCSPLFRESASVGYRIDAHWSVMATVEHLSNAGLCSFNRGLTNYGARVGYTF